MQSSDEQSRDLISAALRHLRDAEHLVSEHSHRSLDQAYHLAGFGPECARKAALAQPGFNKLLGHDLGSASEALLEIVLALEPAAQRYAIDDLGQFPSFSAWRPDCRYKRTGTIPEPAARSLIHEARVFVDRLVVELWADGRLGEIPH